MKFEDSERIFRSKKSSRYAVHQAPLQTLLTVTDKMLLWVTSCQSFSACWWVHAHLQAKMYIRGYREFTAQIIWAFKFGFYNIGAVRRAFEKIIFTKLG